jgi:hypothetical protein
LEQEEITEQIVDSTFKLREILDLNYRKKLRILFCPELKKEVLRVKNKRKAN